MKPQPRIPRHAHRPPKYPQWLSYPPQPRDSAWNDVIAVGIGMLALLACAALAGAMPR